jgi:hypothetical protein
MTDRQSLEANNDALQRIIRGESEQAGRESSAAISQAIFASSFPFLRTTMNNVLPPNSFGLLPRLSASAYLAEAAFQTVAAAEALRQANHLPNNEGGSLSVVVVPPASSTDGVKKTVNNWRPAHDVTPPTTETASASSSAVGTRRKSSEMLENEIELSQEKVTAAFRSKNQPGKKRNDLNENERVELSRARNREHARSARYVPVGSRILLPNRSNLMMNPTHSSSPNPPLVERVRRPGIRSCWIVSRSSSS